MGFGAFRIERTFTHSEDREIMNGAEKKKTEEADASSVFCTSEPVSRVLSFKTAIYLDVRLPARSSRLLNTTGPVCVCSHGVAPDRVYSVTTFPCDG